MSRLRRAWWRIGDYFAIAVVAVKEFPRLWRKPEGPDPRDMS